MSFVRQIAASLSLCAVVALVSGCADAGGAPKKSEPPKPAASKAPEAGSSTGGGTAVPEKK
jgi:hypothetical protein